MQSLKELPDLQEEKLPLGHSLWKIKPLDFTFPCRSASTDLRAQGSEVQVFIGFGELDYQFTKTEAYSAPFPSLALPLHFTHLSTH